MAEFRDCIDIEASPETVFEYLTTDAGMVAWMGQYADLDPTPGGRFAVDSLVIAGAGGDAGPEAWRRPQFDNS